MAEDEGVKKVGEGVKRPYLILEARVGGEGEMPHFQLVGEIQASGSEQALRAHAKRAGGFAEPVVLVAVTKRSWFQKTVKVETQTRLVIE